MKKLVLLQVNLDLPIITRLDAINSLRRKEFCLYHYKIELVQELTDAAQRSLLECLNASKEFLLKNDKILRRIILTTQEFKNE